MMSVQIRREDHLMVLAVVSEKSGESVVLVAFPDLAPATSVGSQFLEAVTGCMDEGVPGQLVLGETFAGKVLSVDVTQAGVTFTDGTFSDVLPLREARKLAEEWVAKAALPPG